MVYTIYQTNCIIFDIKNSGEDDCIIKAFSDKFGIINIIAKSFRKSTSKLKANIKPFSINKIAVVRGKEFFRLTETDNIFYFSGSKSLVTFLRLIEDLFFNDERDYFDEINTQIYEMIIHMCRFIIFTIKSDYGDKNQMLNTINLFFTVYIRGLQGFTDKIDIDDINSLQGDSLYTFLKSKRCEYLDAVNKIKI